MKYIKAGSGVNVDYDFTRLMTDTPFEIERRVGPHVYGTIAGDKNHPCGFMRKDRVRVEARADCVAEAP